jgi:hypothetical protein
MTDAEHEEGALRKRRDEAAAKARRGVVFGWARFFGENVAAALASLLMVIGPCAAGVALMGVNETLGGVFVGLSVFGLLFATFTFLVYVVGRLGRTRGAIPELDRARAIRERLRDDPDFDGSAQEGELTEVDEASGLGGALTESARAAAGSLTDARAADGVAAARPVASAAAQDAPAPGVRSDHVPMTYAEVVTFSAKFCLVAGAIVGGFVGIVLVGSAAVGQLGVLGSLVFVPLFFLVWGAYQWWGRRAGWIEQGAPPPVPGEAGRPDEVVFGFDEGPDEEVRREVDEVSAEHEVGA